MNIVTDVILPLALAFIMFVLGLGLTSRDFLRVLKQPRDFFVGAISQIIILPIIAFVLVKIWTISPELAIGVMIIAAAPGGVTSNLLTSFAKGDVALSISLATIKIEPIAKKFSIILFVLVLLGAIAAERENVISYFAQAGLITLILNVTMMIVAFYLAQFLASGKEQKKCITIECGLQNGTLAIFVATSIFGGGIYVIPAATYSLIMFLTSLIFVYFVRKSF